MSTVITQAWPDIVSDDDSQAVPPLRGEGASHAFRQHVEGPPPSDLGLLSLDNVPFYVHIDMMLSLSPNAFDGTLTSIRRVADFDVPVAYVPLQSTVLNVVLHALYRLDPSEYKPDLPTLSAAVDALMLYDVDPSLVLLPSSPLFSAIMAYAPFQPLKVYMLAAQHNLEDLAVASSQYLLSYPLARITDGEANRIGGSYLRRLFFLHLERTAALQRLLVMPPRMHKLTATCDSSSQQCTKTAWALTAASLLCDLKPDMTLEKLQSILRPLLTSVWCTECRDMLSDHIQSLLTEWSTIQTTI